MIRGDRQMFWYKGDVEVKGIFVLRVFDVEGLCRDCWVFYS
jgi:hypothetical protein